MSRKNLLIIENNPKDVAIATEVARTIDVNQVQAFTTASRAQFFLEKCLGGEMQLPDIILLDLDLEHESGYDLLRFWRTSPGLTKTPLLVWSVLGEHHQEICEVFKVTGYVGKWQGKEALKERLLECLANGSTPSPKAT
jgi:CheY-like chemotaxis protein